MSAAAITILDEAIGSVDRLATNLRKEKNRQVRSATERSLIKATAHAWFHSHKTRLQNLCDAALLSAVDTAFTSILELADRNTTRTKHMAELRDVRERLITVRSTTLKTPLTASRGTDSPAPDFSPLIQDIRMRGILDRRWRETLACLGANAHLAATVMMGGLLEGLLLARINRVQNQAPIFTAAAAPRDKASKTLRLSEWMLKDFLDVAHEIKWISQSAKDVGVVVRDYRNYIHPQKEFTHGIELDAGETSVLWSVFETLARQIIESVKRPP